LEDLGEAGELLDLRDGHARIGDRRGRRPGGDDLHARRLQPAREVLQAGLVVDADQRAPDGTAVLVAVSGHRNLTHKITAFRPSMLMPRAATAETTSTSSRRSTALMRSCRVASSSPGLITTGSCASTGPVSTP